jgi:hypothetical protein
MPLTEQDRDQIESFRTFISDSVATDARYGPASPNDREDQSTLATRFSAGPSCWFEVAVRPLIPQVRVGFVTDDRWKSEELEQAIQDSGDTMPEFIGIALADAGLEWPEPPVEHYREGGQSFYFATPLAIEELHDLDSDEVRDKTLRMLEGYLIAFGPAIAIEGEE